MSLRLRLALGTVATLAVAICAGLIAAYFVVGGQLRSEIDTSLRERSAALATLSRHQPAPPPSRPVRLPAPKLGGAAGYIQFVSPAGRVTLPPGERIRLPTSDARAVAAGRRPSFFPDATVAGTHLRIYVTMVNAGTAAEIARPLTEVDHALARIRLLFLIVALSTLRSRSRDRARCRTRGSAPVRRLTHDAERIANTGNLRERTDERRSDELGRLAHAFNTMLDALTRSVTAQRQLVADASHELRTPLAAARANVELARAPRDSREGAAAAAQEASAELRGADPR